MEVKQNWHNFVIVKIENILDKLPGELQWMVLFNLDAIKEIATEETIKKMYFLNEAIDISSHSYVVLTSQGRYLAPKKETADLFHGENLVDYAYTGPDTLKTRFARVQDKFAIDSVDTLAYGQDDEYGDVFLFVKIDGSTAHATSLFTNEPSQQHYELLPAIGVNYKGGKFKGDVFVAEYENLLPVHIESAIFADFTRTDSCNYFFFKHGNIDANLFKGLSMAVQGRAKRQRAKAELLLAEVAERALIEKLAMSWLPPEGNEKFPFGDLVPLGFVSRALKKTGLTELQERVEKRLLEKKLRGLWSFEMDDLETSIDSALVMQGLNDAKAASLIEKFSDGTGGYYPQLWSMNPVAGEMQFVPEKRHWCQTDLAPTALIYALRRKAGFEPEVKTEQYLLDNFNIRSGLYFANPFLVDWTFAQGLSYINKANNYKELLCKEILAALNSDGSAGKFDHVLSSAFACLALNEAGYRGKAIESIQTFIALNYERHLNGSSIPFYSSLITGDKSFKGRKVSVNGYDLALSFHEDSYNMVYLAAVVMALNLDKPSGQNENDFVEHIPTPLRYTCKTHLEYIEMAALIPYMNANIPLQ